MHEVTHRYNLMHETTWSRHALYQSLSVHKMNFPDLAEFSFFFMKVDLIINWGLSMHYLSLLCGAMTFSFFPPPIEFIEMWLVLCVAL